MTTVTEPGKTLHDFLKRPQTWTRSSAPAHDETDSGQH